MLVTQLCPILWSHGLHSTRLLCPWNSPCKNTGVGCHFLIQGIFSTQGVNSGLPALQTDSLLSEPPGKPPNLGNSHWTADTYTRGKLGNDNVGLMPSIQKHIKGPSATVETHSRDTLEQTVEVVNVGWTGGPGRGGLDSGALLPSQLSFYVELPLLSQPINIPPIFPGSAQTHSPMKPSWTHLSSCWVLFTSLISHEGPVLFCSIICTHAHGFSQLLGGEICALSSVLDPDAHYL